MLFRSLVHHERSQVTLDEKGNLSLSTEVKFLKDNMVIGSLEEDGFKFNPRVKINYSANPFTWTEDMVKMIG